MSIASLIVFISVHLIFIASATQKVKPDFLSHLSENRRSVSKPSDVLDLQGLRIFSIGLTSAQLQSVFESKGKQLAFDNREGTIIRGHWNFGNDISLLELTSVNDWREAQKQEYELRVGGWVGWAERMSDAGYFSVRWLYSYHTFADHKSTPFVILVDDILTSVPSYVTEKAEKAGTVIIPWSSAQEHFASKLKTAVIARAHTKEVARIHAKVYESALATARAEFTSQLSESERKGFTRGVQSERNKRKASENDYCDPVQLSNSERKGFERGVESARNKCKVMEKEYCDGLVSRSGLESAYDLFMRFDPKRASQVDRDAAYARGLQAGQETDTPIEIQLDGHYDELCNLITDTITLEIMENPLLSVRSGNSFSESAIRETVRVNGRDPTNNLEMDQDDLVKNRRLNDLIEVIKPFCKN